MEDSLRMKDRYDFYGDRDDRKDKDCPWCGKDEKFEKDRCDKDEKFEKCCPCCEKKDKDRCDKKDKDRCEKKDKDCCPCEKIIRGKIEGYIPVTICYEIGPIVFPHKSEFACEHAFEEDQCFPLEDMLRNGYSAALRNRFSCKF